MAFLSFYWCHDAFSLFTAWWFGSFVPCSIGLITVGSGTSVGSGVVTVFLLVLVKVLLLPFWISFWLFFIILLVLLLLYLMVLFLCGTVHDQVAAGGVQVVNRGFGSRKKRFRLIRKTPAHLVGHSVHARPRVWKRLHFSGGFGSFSVDPKRRRCDQHIGGASPAFPRTGVGNLGCAGPRLRSARVVISG